MLTELSRRHDHVRGTTGLKRDGKVTARGFVALIVCALCVLCVTHALAQDAIPRSAHNALLSRLDLHEHDADVAAAAYDHFIHQWEMLEHVPRGFDAWTGSLRSELYGGRDEEMLYRLVLHRKHVDGRTKQVRRDLEQMYFDTLRTMCDAKDVETIDAMERSRVRQRWVGTRRTYGEHRRASVSVDLRDVVASLDINVDDTLEAALLQWELELDDVLRMLDDVYQDARPSFADGMTLNYVVVLSDSGRDDEAMNYARRIIDPLVERVAALCAVREVQLAAVDEVARTLPPVQAMRFRVACTSVLLPDMDFTSEALVSFDKALRDPAVTAQQRRMLEGLFSEFASDHNTWARRLARRHDAMFNPQLYREYYERVARDHIDGTISGGYPPFPGRAEYDEVRRQWQAVVDRYRGRIKEVLR